MKRRNQCPKCGSTEVIPDAKAIDRTHLGVEWELSVATFSKPDALVFKGQRSTALSAWVCTACGFVEFYADLPANIKAGPRGSRRGATDEVIPQGALVQHPDPSGVHQHHTAGAGGD